MTLPSMLSRSSFSPINIKIPLAFPFASNPPKVTASINPGPMPDHVVHSNNTATALANSLNAQNGRALYLFCSNLNILPHDRSFPRVRTRGLIPLRLSSPTADSFVVVVVVVVVVLQLESPTVSFEIVVVFFSMMTMISRRSECDHCSNNENSSHSSSSLHSYVV